MKFNRIPLLGFVSTALVLSLSFAPGASASTVVRRSDLSNRSFQAPVYVNNLDNRADSKSEQNLGLENYAEEQLNKNPTPSKSEIVAGLTKKLHKGIDTPLQKLYNDLDSADPVVADLRADVDSITKIVDELNSALSDINQNSKISKEVTSDGDTKALKKVVDKVQTYFNYIKTTPKLNQIEKARILAGTHKLSDALNALVSNLRSLLSIVDTTVSGVVQDVLAPLIEIIDFVTHLA